LKSFLDNYISYLFAEKHLSEHSIKAYKKDLDRYFEFLTEKYCLKNINDITHMHIREYMRLLYDLNFQPTTIRRNISSIQSYHKFLSLENILSKNPSLIIEQPKLSKRIPKILSVTEINAIIDAVNVKSLMGYRDKAILEVLYSAGLRVSELCDLLIQKPTLPNERILKVNGKNKKDRLVPIGNKAIDSIKVYIRKIRDKQKVPKNEKHLFLSNNAKKLTRMTINNIVKKWSQAAGIIKSVHPHIFRHSFATHLIDGGANIIQIQMMLGHADVSTTQIYTHHDTLFKTSELQKYHPRW